MSNHNEQLASQLKHRLVEGLEGLLREDDRDLLEHLEAIELDLAEAALTGRDDLCAQLVDQLRLLGGVARGRVSERALETARVLIGTVVGAARDALLHAGRNFRG